MIFPTLTSTVTLHSLPKTDNNDITDWDSANGKKDLSKCIQQLCIDCGKI